MKECHGKQSYSYNEVKRKKRASMKARNKKIRYYECPECFNYHLTSNVGTKLNEII